MTVHTPIHSTPTRRRFLKISAATLGAATIPAAAWASSHTNLLRWHGIALGAEAEILISHPVEREGREILAGAEAELRRLEGIFSLYQNDSVINLLNRDGHLTTPPPEFVELLATSLSISSLTQGAFDPSVQPLWVLYAKSFGETGGPPSANEISRATGLVGTTGIEVSAQHVALPRSGMALTLNGIAQGYITDRITDLLRGAGLTNVLVDLGEIRPLGHHPSGRPWRVEVESSATPLSFAKIDRAVSTTTTQMTLFDKEGLYHHLFDAQIGRPSSEFTNVSVVAPTATLADGVSTALAVTPESEWNNTLTELREMHLEIYATRKNGSKLSHTM